MKNTWKYWVILTYRSAWYIRSLGLIVNFGKLMSRDGIIGSLFDNFHYFMISQSTSDL